MRRAKREFAGEFAAARALDLADGRVVSGARGNLGAGDEMTELGEIDEYVRRLGAGPVERAHEVERAGDVAAHRFFEEGDDFAAVGEAEHVAHGGR